MLKNVHIQEKEECVIEVSLTVDKEMVAEPYKKSVQKVQQQAKMKGFRPGKAPVNLIENVYEGQIRYEMVNTLFPAIYQILEKEHQIKASKTPEIDGFEDYKKGEDLQLKLTIEVVPKINQLADLSKVEITKVEYDYDEKQMIEKELEMLQGVHAHYHDITDTIEEGNFVKANFSFTIDDFTQEKQSQYFAIQKEDPQYLISQHFIGKKIGETHTAEVSFPEDYAPNKDLSGKKGKVEFELEEGKSIHKPEIDDELAKKFEFESLDALKKQLKVVIAKKAEMRSLFDTVDLFYDDILEGSTFSISEKVILEQTQGELQNLLQRVMQTQSMDDYLKDNNLTEANFIDETKNKARKNIEKYLVGEHLIEKFDIKATPSELDDFIKDIAEQEVTNQKEIIDYYQQNQDKKETVKNQLEVKKLAEKLLTEYPIKKTLKKNLEDVRGND